MQTDPTLLLAFLAGLASFFSPCVLPLLPGYLALVAGLPAGALLEETGPSLHWRRLLFSVAAFVLGFSAVFVSMGIAATAVGRLLQTHRLILQRVAGLIVLIFGLHLLGVLRLTALYRERRFHFASRPVGLAGALLIGMAFAFGWTPCVGPILGSVLLLASTSESVRQGAALLAVYSAGLGLPFLATGLAAGSLLPLLGRIRGGLRTVEVGGGALLVLIGVLIFLDKLSLISEQFGFLSRFYH
jgi:cytochrome c-type biogenesis protein